VRVNRSFQWPWNTRGKIRASTFCGNGSGEVNDEGCCKKSLADAFIASLGVVSDWGTHKKTDSMAASKFLFLFQSTYVLRMKKTG
jgi:hypothetical protein